MEVLLTAAKVAALQYTSYLLCGVHRLISCQMHHSNLCNPTQLSHLLGVFAIEVLRIKLVYCCVTSVFSLLPVRSVLKSFLFLVVLLVGFALKALTLAQFRSFEQFRITSFCTNNICTQSVSLQPNVSPKLQQTSGALVSST